MASRRARLGAPYLATSVRRSSAAFVRHIPVLPRRAFSRSSIAPVLRFGARDHDAVPASRPVPRPSTRDEGIGEPGEPRRGRAPVETIERLLHYSTPVKIRGERYRLKDNKRADIFTVPGAMAGDSDGEFETGDSAKSVLRSPSIQPLWFACYADSELSLAQRSAAMRQNSSLGLNVLA
jgi:hypothetical protein